MEKKMVIIVDDKEYPCYPTMGACVRFHDMTGKEVAEVKGWQTSLQCVYLYCCVKSACEREKKDFPYECTEFCDNVPLDQLYAWLQSEAEKVSEEDAEKKVRRNNGPYGNGHGSRRTVVRRLLSS